MKIDFEKLTPQQRSNLEVALDAYNKRKLISSPSPPILYVELTQNCIARCDFCRPKWPGNNPSYNMDDKIFDILLKDYIPYASFVDLRAWGESLILQNFDEYVNKIAKFGPRIQLVTTLACGNKKALQSLIDNDVYISVSLDTADKKTYESIRKGANYDTVIKNIEFLTREIAKKHGNPNSRMRLAIVPLQRKNLDYLEGIIQLAIRYNISEICLGPLFSFPKNRNLLEYNKAKTKKALRTCVKYAKKYGIKFQLLSTPFPELRFSDKVFDLCCHPWLYTVVNYQGKACLCDHILGTGGIKHSIGNVTEDKESVWNGKEAQRQRLAHIQKNMAVTSRPCVKCYVKGRYADHEHEIDDQFKKWLVTEKDIENRLKSRFNTFKIFFR